MACAQGEYIVLMDADGQDDPSELPLAPRPHAVEALDLVIGRRAGCATTAS